MCQIIETLDEKFERAGQGKLVGTKLGLEVVMFAGFFVALVLIVVTGVKGILWGFSFLLLLLGIASFSIVFGHSPELVKLLKGLAGDLAKRLAEWSHSN